MAQYKVKAPDGSTITVNGPEGASQEEVIAQAKKLYRPKVADKQTTEDAMAERGATLSSVLGDVAGAAAEYSPISLAAQGINKLTGDRIPALPSAVKAYSGNLVGGLSEPILGARQAYTEQFGDPYDAALQGRDEEWRRKRLAELTGDHNIIGGAGKIVGNALPWVAGGELLGASKAVAALPKLAESGNISQAAANALKAIGITSGLGTAGGAIQGVTVPLTRSEQKNDVRGSSTASGALLGGLLGPAIPAIQGAKNVVSNFKSRMVPEENLADLVFKARGITKDTQTGPMLRKIRSAHTKAIEENTKISKGLEEQIRLKYAAEGMPEVDIPTGLFTESDLANKDIIKAISASPYATKLSRGQSMVGYGNTSPSMDLETAFNAAKDLRKSAAELSESATSKDTAKSLINMADRIEGQARSSGKFGELFDEYKAADDWTTENVRKLTDEGYDYSGKFGQWNAGGRELDHLDNELLPNYDAWRTMQSKIPGGYEAFKDRYMATKLLRGDEQVKYLNPKDISHQLWPDPAMREHAQKTAEKLGNNSNWLSEVTQMLSKNAPWAGGKIVDKLARSYMPFGVTPDSQTMQEILANALRGTAAAGTLNSSSGALPPVEPPPLIITRGRPQ